MRFLTITDSISIKLDWANITGETLKAGTPVTVEGIVSNGDAAIGLLANDTAKGNGNAEVNVVTSGVIDIKEIEMSYGDTLTDECISALQNITFIENGKPILPNYAPDVSSWPKIRALVRAGRAQEAFALGDQLRVTKGDTELVFDVVAFDQHTPANASLSHSMSLLLHDLSAGMPFSVYPTAILAVKTGSLPAGTYYFEVGDGYDTTHASGYSYVEFTTTQAIPNGGQMVLSWGNNAELSAAKISTYQKFSATPIESDLAISNTNTGTKLGTLANSTVGETTIGSVVVRVNNVSRARLGSNDIRVNKIMRWLSSSAASGWDAQQDEFDRPMTTPTAGFLYGVDPAFVNVLGKVKLRTALNTVTDSGYYDGEHLGWLPSLTELGGGANNSVYEVSPNADGQYTNAPLGIYVGAIDADRIKYAGTTALKWWMRSPNTGYATACQNVSPTGTLAQYHSASDNDRVAAGFDIV